MATTGTVSAGEPSPQSTDASCTSCTPASFTVAVKTAGSSSLTRAPEMTGAALATVTSAVSVATRPAASVTWTATA